MLAPCEKTAATTRPVAESYTETVASSLPTKNTSPAPSHARALISVAASVPSPQDSSALSPLYIDSDRTLSCPTSRRNRADGSHIRQARPPTRMSNSRVLSTLKDRADTAPSTGATRDKRCKLSKSYSSIAPSRFVAASVFPSGLDTSLAACTWEVLALILPDTVSKMTTSLVVYATAKSDVSGSRLKVMASTVRCDCATGSHRPPASGL